MRTQYSNCPCAGTWRDKLIQWVVLDRGEKSSKLKCLRCGWKWRSRCKYVQRLPDWKERSRRGLTDSDILDRLLSGSLKICPTTAVVTSNGRGCWVVLNQVEDQHGSGYRFVSVCVGGRKKKIAVHRLQWMAATGELIPEGYDVHHKTSPRRPEEKCNAICNLELRESLENQIAGYPGADEVF